MKCVHSLSIQKAENHKETSLFFLFHIMCTGLLYFYYSEELSVAQGKILISSDSFKKENKSLQVLSESYNKYVFPLNSPSFHLALLSVLKLVCILKVNFSGPSPMYIFFMGLPFKHGTVKSTICGSWSSCSVIALAARNFELVKNRERKH